MTHRYLGIFILLFAVVLHLLAELRPGLTARQKAHSFVVLILLLVQIMLGLANVAMRIPVSVTVAHLVVAEGILLVLALLYRDLNPGLRIFQPVGARAGEQASWSTNMEPQQV